jgi:hypothetical protein
VIAFVSAAALQIPEVQSWVVQVASDLQQVVAQMADSIKTRIDALGAISMPADPLKAIRVNIGALGIVAATSIASEPGEGFSLIDPEPSPNDPPSQDPRSVASVDAASRSELPPAQARPGSPADQEQEKDAFDAMKLREAQTGAELARMVRAQLYGSSPGDVDDESEAEVVLHESQRGVVVDKVVGGKPAEDSKAREARGASDAPGARDSH